jgi:hypothetical protein
MLLHIDYNIPKKRDYFHNANVCGSPACVIAGEKYIFWKKLTKKTQRLPNIFDFSH